RRRHHVGLRRRLAPGDRNRPGRIPARGGFRHHPHRPDRTVRRPERGEAQAGVRHRSAGAVMAMKNRWLVLLVLLFFLLDGALFPWLLPQPRPDGFAVSPRLALAGILFAAMFRNRNLGLALGLVIGFMQDIVHHGPMLGVHAFGMTVSAYVAGTVGMKAKKGVLLPLVAMALGLVLHESIAFSLYLLFQTAD